MISFASLYGFLLLGLIPLVVLLHALRTRPKHRDVSHLPFWRDLTDSPAAAKKISMPWWRRPLLWLQILFVILAALALAHPQRPVDDLRRAVVVVMDASASMQTHDGESSRFEKARRLALEAVSALAPAAPAMVVRSGARATVVVGPGGARGDALTALRQMTPSDAPGRLSDALCAAITLSASVGGSPVLVYSDGAGEAACVRESKYPRVRWVPVSGGTDNVAVTRLALRAVADKTPRWQAMVVVANYNPEPVDAVVNLSVDGHILISESLHLPADGQIRRFHDLVGRAQGVLAVDLQRPDHLMLDNRAAAALQPPGEVWGLWVGPPDPFVDAVLSAYPNLKINTVSRVSSESWVRQAADNDLVIINRAAVPGPAGGNLLFLNCAPPDSGLTVTGQLNQTRLTVRNRSHPANRHVNPANAFAGQALALSVGQPWQCLAGSQDACVAAAAEDHDGKRVVLGLDPGRSSLVWQADFPIWMHNILTYLSPDLVRPVASGANTGETMSFHLPPGAGTAVVLGPDGRRQRIATRHRDIAIGPFERSGNYVVTAGSMHRRVAVSLKDAVESDIRTRKPGQASQTRSLPLEPAAGLDTVQQPLWPVALMLLLLVLVVEWYVWLPERDRPARGIRKTFP